MASTSDLERTFWIKFLGLTDIQAAKYSIDDLKLQGLAVDPTKVFVPTSKTGNELIASSLWSVLGSWYAALANRDNVRANIVVLGDSVSGGGQVSTYNNKFTIRLASQLRNRFGFPVGGRGFINPIQNGSGYTWAPGPVTLVGAAPHGVPYQGPNFNAITITGANTETFALVGTSCDIMWFRQSYMGSFSYAVDGGAPITVNCAGAKADGILTRVTLGAAGAHTLTIAAVSGTSYIDGVIEYNGDENAGIMVHDCGYAGITSTQWVSNMNDPNAQDLAWASAVTSLSPNLLLIELGLNDVFHSIGSATYAANLTAIIAKVRTGTGMSALPVILVIPYAEKNFDGAWPAYVTAAYGVAAIDPLTTVCDLSVRLPWPDTSTPLGLYNVDGIHPNDKGHAAIADIITKVLIPV